MRKKLVAMIIAGAVLLGGIVAAGVALGRPAPAAQPPADGADSAREVLEDSAPETQTDSAPETETGNAINGLPDYTVTLEGDTITAAGVQNTGSVLTVNRAGNYHISGTLRDGQILVDAGKDAQVWLFLEGADVTCSTGAPIYVKKADRVVICTRGENTVTDSRPASLSQEDGSALEEAPEEPAEAPEESAEAPEDDAAIFSKDDLIFAGDGVLTVSASYDKAVHGKDDVKVESGTLILSAPGDGLKGKDSVEIEGGDVTIDAGGDGVQTGNQLEKGDIVISGGKLTVNAGQDGVKSVHSLTVAGGTLDITAGEDGLKAQNVIGGSELTIAGGEITLDTQQDAVQADGNLFVRDGTLNIVTLGGAENAPEHAGDFGPPPGWFNDASEEETASAKGLKSAYDIEISGGEITLDTYDDAIHADGNVTISGEASIQAAAGDDGIHATDTLSIQGGSLRIERSYEGLEGLYIQISDGEVYVKASDDGMNANGEEMFGPFGGNSQETLEDARTYLHITGGHVLVDSEGDGLDSNGLLLIEGGEVYVAGPSSSMNGALDSGSSARINGGKLLAIGVSGMDETFEDSSAQASLRCVFNTTLPGDCLITLTDSNGHVLLEFQNDAPDKRFNSVVFSSPELEIGETYTLTCGEEQVVIEQTEQSTKVRQTQAGSQETQANAGFGGFGGPGGPPGGPPGFH